MLRHSLLFVLLLLLPALSPAQKQPELAYTRFFPGRECDPVAFSLAWKGYHRLLREGLIAVPQYLTVIDYSLPSHKPRLFLLDVPAQRLSLSSIVAHGVGSDPDSLGIPRQFSNREGSRMSSLGFYLTGDPYVNFRPGDSLGLCLFGLDEGINDSAAAREIVLHYGATEYRGKVYVTDSGAARSYGCPALPLSTNTKIISRIRGGSLLFIYSPVEAGPYQRRSSVLNHGIRLPLIQQGPPPNNCSCHLDRK